MLKFNRLKTFNRVNIDGQKNNKHDLIVLEDYHLSIDTASRNCFLRKQFHKNMRLDSGQNPRVL